MSMKYTITRNGDDINVALGTRYNVSFPQDTTMPEVMQIINLLVETTCGINTMQIIEDVLKEQQKNG